MRSKVGPALAKELSSQLGSYGFAIQGVDCNAIIASSVPMGADVRFARD
jgi:hypothetical protein